MFSWHITFPTVKAGLRRALSSSAQSRHTDACQAPYRSHGSKDLRWRLMSTIDRDPLRFPTEAGYHDTRAWNDSTARAAVEPGTAGEPRSRPKRHRRSQRLPMYIVISKPKRISVKSGLVHMVPTSGTIVELPLCCAASAACTDTRIGRNPRASVKSESSSRLWSDKSTSCRRTALQVPPPGTESPILLCSNQPILEMPAPHPHRRYTARRETRGNVSEAAGRLGVSRMALRYRIDKLGLDPRRAGGTVRPC